MDWKERRQNLDEYIGVEYLPMHHHTLPTPLEPRKVYTALGSIGRAHRTFNDESQADMIPRLVGGIHHGAAQRMSRRWAKGQEVRVPR